MVLFGSKPVITDPLDDAVKQQQDALSLFDQATAGLEMSNRALSVVYESSEAEVERLEAAIRHHRERQTLANDNINKNLRVKAKIVALTE